MGLKILFYKKEGLVTTEMFGGLDWDNIKRYLAGVKQDTDLMMSITRVKKADKTSEQLGYHYAVVLPTATKAMKANEEITLDFRIAGKVVCVPLTQTNVDTFLKLRFGEYKGEYYDKSEMPKEVFSEYLDWAIKWCNKFLNCQIPLADKDWKRKGWITDGD